MKNARPRGRPLSFNRDIALQKAAERFWSHGYEGTSITDLTSAMGITPQSLYTAFRSKAGLYQEALDWYADTFGNTGLEALEGPGAVKTLSAWLLSQARAFASSSYPKGCMISVAALGCATENSTVARMASQKREATIALLQRRLTRAISEGELDKSADPDALARFIGAILQGMTVQARDGASEAQLVAIAKLATDSLHQALRA
ncbi:TetR/AcrR family transcriptional regulator [Pseudomonas sp. REB1044]|uniref:TetR/AcrR family transcriptional regulator n=1 Tax=Pseudomonas sp. REB1044 TaxID=2675224 RepID=UPI00315C540B